jgi:hypothetical protein
MMGVSLLNDVSLRSKRHGPNLKKLLHGRPSACRFSPLPSDKGERTKVRGFITACVECAGSTLTLPLSLAR